MIFLRVFGRFLFLLFITWIGTKAAMRYLGGDPIEILLGESPAPARVEALKKELGLDLTFQESIARDFKRITHGDLGKSFVSGSPIRPTLIERTLKSIQLGVFAVGLGFFIALSVAAASASGMRLSKRILSVWYTISSCMPVSWLAPVLLLVLSVWIPLFPISGSIFLPVLTLSFLAGGIWAKLSEGRIEERMKRGSVQGARARGTSEWRVLAFHAVFPALPSLLGALGAQVGGLLGGAFLIEVLFGWPGLGAYLVDSVLSRDFPAVEACVLMSASLSLFGVVLGDFLQSALDPREAHR